MSNQTIANEYNAWLTLSSIFKRIEPIFYDYTAESNPCLHLAPSCNKLEAFTVMICILYLQSCHVGFLF